MVHFKPLMIVRDLRLMVCNLGGCLASLLCVAALNASAQASSQTIDTLGVDPYVLATRLIKDGRFDRAKHLLDGMRKSLKLGEGSERADESESDRYFMTEGLWFLFQDRYQEGLESLDAIRSVQSRTYFYHLYRAQALFGLKRYEGCLDSLALAASLREENDPLPPSLIVMRVKSLRGLGLYQKAYEQVQEGLIAHGDAFQLLIEKLALLLELKLTQEAGSLVEAFVKRGLTNDEVQHIVRVVYDSGVPLPAVPVLLEACSLKHPTDLTLLAELALSYARHGQPLAAAQLFEQAARLEPRYHLEAAELYLKAGRIHRALWLNSQVLEQKQKLPQRMAILFKLGRLEQIAAMKQALSRYGLLDKDDIRYALAYALVASSELQQADELLSGIKSETYFQKSALLRKEMSRCREEKSRCFL